MPQIPRRQSHYVVVKHGRELFGSVCLFLSPSLHISNGVRTEKDASTPPEPHVSFSWVFILLQCISYKLSLSCIAQHWVRLYTGTASQERLRRQDAGSVA